MEYSVALILLTIALVALIDYVPRAFLKIKKPIRVKKTYARIPSYYILPTVYGDISYLQNTSFLKKYADKVVICTSTYETEAFYRDLEAVCRKYGFKYFRSQVPIVRGKPVRNAYSIYAGFFAALKTQGISPDTPCLLIDADTYATDNVNHLIRSFKKSKLDMASLRCEAANPVTTIEKLQAFEYMMAMDNRSMDPWLTSGACNIATAAAYRHTFANHSNFFAGGDIEIGKIATVMGYHVGHIDFTFYTALPNTFRDWFKQRLIWFAGGCRHHVTNMASFGWYHFFMLFYNSLIIYLLLPLRWIEFINFPLTMLALIVLSWIYTYILIAGRGWKKTYLLLPFYSAIQSMIILPLACIKYLRISYDQKSFGKLRYDLKGIPLTRRTTYVFLNLSSATLIIVGALTFTAMRIDYWNNNGYLAKLMSQWL